MLKATVGLLFSTVFTLVSFMLQLMCGALAAVGVMAVLAHSET